MVETAAVGPAGHIAPVREAGHPASLPRRVLVVSASPYRDVAAALAGQVGRLWPGSEVAIVDVTGARSDRCATGSGWYDLGYAALWRHRWLAPATKRLGGAWAGRRLAGRVEAFDPDLIVSTSPLGSAGLAWLRRARGLDLPLGAWLATVAPHPLSLHRELDLHVLPHPAALPLAAAALPGARVGVAAPAPGQAADQAGARRRCGLDPARPVVLVMCGPARWRPAVEAVRALVASGAGQVVAVCLHRRVAGRLAGTAGPVPGLRLWSGPVDDLRHLLAAADLVVTSDSGAAVRRALAAGAAVVLYRPFHATAAAVHSYAGLAETCLNPRQLAAVVSTRLAAGSPEPRVEPGGLPGSGLPALAVGQPARTGPPRSRSWPLRSQDAFFQYVEIPTVAQQIGVVLELDPGADGRPLTLADLVTVLRQRLPVLTTLRRQVVPRGGWARPGWRLAAEVDPARHVHEHRLAPGAVPGPVIDEFWTAPLAADRPLWQILLISGLPGGRVRLAMKLHHSLGDGLSAIGTLQRLLDPAPAERAGTTDPASGATPAAHHRQDRDRPPPARPGAVRQTALVARGLVRLARAGRAPHSPLNRPLPGPHRKLVTTTLPAGAVQAASRILRTHPSALVCALVAEALRRAYPGDLPPTLRATFAVTSRAGPRAPTQGNWTGAVALDLPLSPMPVDARVDLVRQRLRRGLGSGQPVAAELVMRALGRLPGRLHAAAARWIYTWRFMNIIVSYVPGPAVPQQLAGAPVTAAAPVVALADGVPLGVAVMRWAGGFGVGALFDASLEARLNGHGEGFVSALHAALADLLRGSEPGAPGPGVREAVPCE